jgi:hypothetical protein
MNKPLLFFAILLSLGTNAQVGKIKIKKEMEKKEKPVKPQFYHHYSVDLYYGYRVYDKNYYQQLNSPDHLDLKLPVSFAGFGVSGYPLHFGMTNRILGQANYYKIIPNRIYIEDTLHTKFSGFVMGYGVGASLATRKRKLSLAAYIGFNAGRSTLSKNEFITLKNQFFSPKIAIQPKFIIVKRIAISIMLEAEYDVTNPAWRQTVFERKDLYLLQPFRQTCYTAVISVGYKFY